MVPADCAAVVKADAYGCGIDMVAAALAKAGCVTFFVAHIAEARRVRGVAPEAAIYVLSGFAPGSAPAFAEINARPVIGSLSEFVEVEGNGCSIGPNNFDIAKETAGKKIAIFALPGAFTPTCSAKHVPGYVNNYDALKAKGVDAIACLSVNDAFVMGAWGKDQQAGDKVHMLADGNGDFTRAVGLEMDGTKFGMGKRSQRYSMIVDNGVVKVLNVEQPGAFEVSSAEHMLGQI